MACSELQVVDFWATCNSTQSWQNNDGKKSGRTRRPQEGKERCRNPLADSGEEYQRGLDSAASAAATATLLAAATAALLAAALHAARPGAAHCGARARTVLEPLLLALAGTLALANHLRVTLPGAMAEGLTGPLACTLASALPRPPTKTLACALADTLAEGLARALTYALPCARRTWRPALGRNRNGKPRQNAAQQGLRPHCNLLMSESAEAAGPASEIIFAPQCPPRGFQIKNPVTFRNRCSAVTDK